MVPTEPQRVIAPLGAISRENFAVRTYFFSLLFVRVSLLETACLQRRQIVETFEEWCVHDEIEDDERAREEQRVLDELGQESHRRQNKLK